MKKVWITKNRQHLKIKDMSVQHIKNCIKLLHKYHSKELSNYMAFGSMLQGDIAVQTWEDGLNGLEENGWEDKAEDFIFAFEEELQRRKGNP